MTKSSKRQPSVFLGTQEIAGYYVNLEAGLVEIGVNARLVTTHPHPFDYGQGQENPWPAAFASRAVLSHRKASGVPRMFFAALYLLGSILTLLWALPRYRVFVFAWGISILPGNIDVLILRMFGKRVISILGHGSEARPPYMSTPRGDLPLSEDLLEKMNAETRTIAQTVRRLEAWSTVTVGMLATAQFFTRPFVDFYQIGLPTPRREDARALKVSQTSSGFIVLHVPSNMAVKGTARIREAMDAIVKKHPHVRYRELSGVPHEEVMGAMREADLVVDWLWSDIPMAVVGTEAASLGTPTVISGYAWPLWDAWEKLHPGKRPPAIFATPQTLLDDIERAIVDSEGTRRLGAQAREFVQSQWSHEQVARNFLPLLVGDVPAEYVLEPSDVTYLWGAGVSRAAVLSMVTALVQKYGQESLRWPGASGRYAAEAGKENHE
jgi:hypothetical protein